MIWFTSLIVWFLGAVSSRAVLAAMGERNPSTYSDSFSGDDVLDLLLAVFWPIFWPAFVIYSLTYRMVG